jgi:adenosylmethionine-8-amino-7-oxononanoate aminotransferase
MAYHGATMGAGSLTGMPGFHEQFGPMLPKVVHVFPPYCYRCWYGKEYPECDLQCVRGLEETIKFEGSDSIVGVVGEPCLGGGGMVPPPNEYWPMVSEICKNNDLLLLIDEILTGFGRTGKFFASEHWNLKPDIMTIGKGLSSGYMPISAACPTPEISETFLGQEKWFVHGHSWATSSPLLCTAASAVIDVMRNEKMPEKAAETGRHMLKRLKELEEIPIVGDVRGLGLFGAVELVKDKKTKEVFPREWGEMTEDMLIRRGLMLWCRWGYSTFLACCPPLIITRKQIDDSVEIIREVLWEVSKKIGAK